MIADLDKLADPEGPQNKKHHAGCDIR